MNGIHDLGGRDGIGAVAPPESEPVWKAEWEKAAHAMFPLAFRAGFFGLDQFRFAMEQMNPVEYLTSAYYEHWLHAVEHYVVAAGAFDPDDIEKRTRYYLENPDAAVPDKQDPALVEFIDGVTAAGATAVRDTGKTAAFHVGDQVTVIADAPRRPHPQGLLHPRQDRRHRAGPRRDDLPGLGGQRPRRGSRARLHRALHQRGALGRRGGRAERFGHLRRLGALHRPRDREGERRMSAPNTVESIPAPDHAAQVAARVKAIEAIMIEKGLMSTDAVDRVAAIYENEVGPQLGAKAVAKAWTDPDFKSRLLENATAACAELGIGGLQGEEMVAVEDTDDVHHVIVCTLCSCYPWPVLGLPPNWSQTRTSVESGTA